MKYVTFLMVVLSCLSSYGDKRGFIMGLYIKNADWDFGTVKANDVMKHTFIIENPANKKCIIKSVLASCGCTKYELEKDTLYPKEKCKLNVLLKTPNTVGYFMRDISIYSTISDKPNVITLNGYIPVSKEYVKRNYQTKLQEGLYAKTDVIYIGNLYKNKQQNGKIELVNTTNKIFDIDISVKPNEKWVEIVGTKKLEPWKPELLTFICDGSKIGDIWGEKHLYVHIGNKSIKCVVTLIPMDSPYIKKGKARIFVPLGNDSSKIEIRNVGNDDLHLLKVQTIKKSQIAIRDSVIHTNQCGHIDIYKKVDNDTLEILSNDDMNPVIQIPINYKRPNGISIRI